MRLKNVHQISFYRSLNDHVWFDKEFVESIAFNMLSNAFKFTPNGHEIALSVRIDTDSVLLIFSNTGASVDDKQQIFNRFYSTAKKNSTGVGLDFTKKLIELHKGSISVESEGGAELFLRLHCLCSMFTAMTKKQAHQN